MAAKKHHMDFPFTQMNWIEMNNDYTEMDPILTPYIRYFISCENS